MRPLVRTATLNRYAGLARSLDLDAAQLMRDAGLDPGTWPPRQVGPSGRGVPTSRDSAAASGHADFAVRLAELR